MSPDSRYEESAVAESAEKVDEPPLFQVLLHNDDYTTMDFVVWVLQSIFSMGEEQAIQVMLNVHVQGVGVAGTKRGRQRDDEVIIFDSTGMALQDVAAAAIVYERAVAAGRGTAFDFAAF